MSKKFKTKEIKMLEKLVKASSKEAIALEFGVDPRTIQRWLDNENHPPYASRRYIAQLYELLKAQDKK